MRIPESSTIRYSNCFQITFLSFVGLACDNYACTSHGIRKRSLHIFYSQHTSITESPTKQRDLIFYRASCFSYENSSPCCFCFLSEFHQNRDFKVVATPDWRDSGIKFSTSRLSDEYFLISAWMLFLLSCERSFPMPWTSADHLIVFLTNCLYLSNRILYVQLWFPASWLLGSKQTPNSLSKDVFLLI